MKLTFIPIISLKRNSFDASNNIIHLPTFLKMSFIIIVPCQLFGSVFYFKHFVRHSVWLKVLSRESRDEVCYISFPITPVKHPAPAL